MGWEDWYFEDECKPKSTEALERILGERKSMKCEVDEKYKWSKMRIDMEKAYQEISHRREYKSARIMDILDWLAEYCEHKYSRDRESITELEAKLEIAVEALEKSLLVDSNMGHYYSDFVVMRDKAISKIREPGK